jgi:hypothetical protein
MRDVEEASAPPIEDVVAAGWRRAVGWAYVAATAIVAAGVLLQAFSITAYIRGAGEGARDLHVNGGLITHNVEIVAFVLALVAFWGAWRFIGLALLLPVIGTAQVFFVGDTEDSGGWVNGLHGLLAMVVLVLALALGEAGRRRLSA